MALGSQTGKESLIMGDRGMISMTSTDDVLVVQLPYELLVLGQYFQYIGWQMNIGESEMTETVHVRMQPLHTAMSQ